MTEIAASFLGSLLALVESVVKFYVPLFFTFRFLRDKDVQGQRRIVKFWCLYSIFFILDWFLQPVISKNIYPLIEIGLFGLMNYESYAYAQKIYDMIIPPLFERHKSSIEQLAQQIEQVFKQQTKKLQKGVQESFQAKAKRVAGSILVNVMNPNLGQEERDKEQ